MLASFRLDAAAARAATLLLATLTLSCAQRATRSAAAAATVIPRDTEGTLELVRSAPFPADHDLVATVGSTFVTRDGARQPIALPPGTYQVAYGAVEDGDALPLEPMWAPHETVVIAAGRATKLELRALAHEPNDVGMIIGGVTFAVLGSVLLPLSIWLLQTPNGEPSEEGAITDSIGIVGVGLGTLAAGGGLVLTVVGSVPRLRWRDEPAVAPARGPGHGSLQLSF